jgi:hypothetical protein
LEFAAISARLKPCPDTKRVDPVARLAVVVVAAKDDAENEWGEALVKSF